MIATRARAVRHATVRTQDATSNHQSATRLSSLVEGMEVNQPPCGYCHSELALHYTHGRVHLAQDRSVPDNNAMILMHRPGTFLSFYSFFHG